ncbi:MAG: DUF3488 and transglutaminase-like domain-containing protein [Methylacidiphilales bacterium]|nr:DUF3488 and transglutaminase-like domain-containing protein [Candidatus Methylacidiphilales bacterium]
MLNTTNAQSIQSHKHIVFILFIFNSLPQIQHHPWWVVPMLALFYVVTLRLSITNKKLSTYLIFGLIPIVFFIFLYQLNKSNGGLYWGSSLLLSATGFKIAETENQKDLKITCFLLIMLNLTSLLYKVEIINVMYSSVLLIINLALFNFTEQQLFSIKKYIAACNQTLIMIVIMLPLTIVLFVFYPRYSSGYSNQTPEDKNISVSGLPEVMDMNSIESLTLSNEIQFIAKIEPEIVREDLYFRAKSLGMYKNNSWNEIYQQTLSTSEFLKWRTPQKQQETYQIKTLYRQPIKRWYYTLERVVSISGNYQPLSSGDLLSNEITGIKFNTSESTIDGNLPDQLTQYEQFQYTYIDRSQNPKTFQLGNELKQNTTLDTIKQINMFFKDANLQYTLSPGKSPQNSSDYFLFINKKGFCEHFASSYALLLRASGVPSRIVLGFLGGEWDSYSKGYVIRNKHAHAWVEAYSYETEEWLRVDPTTLVVASETIQSLFQKKSDADSVQEIMFSMFQSIDFWWNENIVGYTGTKSDDGLQESASHVLGFKPLYGWLLLGLLLLVFFIQEITNYFKNKNNYNQILKNKWGNFLVILRGQGFDFYPHETEENIKIRVINQHSKDRRHIKKIVRYINLFQKIKYFTRFKNKSKLLDLRLKIIKKS